LNGAYEVFWGVRMRKNTMPPAINGDEPRRTMAEAILALIGQIPGTAERRRRQPGERARSIARSAALKAAVTSGTLALPPGPLGWLTIPPELMTIWRIQAQMVVDIAGTYGRHASLTREQMLYCLFRHTAAQAVREVAVRVGERFVVRRTSLRATQGIAQKVALRITRRAVGRGVSRWLPVIGALGVGAYAYYDTMLVARTAVELLSHEIEVEPDEPGPRHDRP
jgi:hypothetical protein